MESELTELNYRKLLDLEKKLNLYINLLNNENELDFILKGTYILNTDIQSILNGTYTIGD